MLWKKGQVAWSIIGKLFVLPIYLCKIYVLNILDMDNFFRILLHREVLKFWLNQTFVCESTCHTSWNTLKRLKFIPYHCKWRSTERKRIIFLSDMQQLYRLPNHKEKNSKHLVWLCVIKNFTDVHYRAWDTLFLLVHNSCTFFSLTSPGLRQTYQQAVHFLFFKPWNFFSQSALSQAIYRLLLCLFSFFLKAYA